MSKNILENLFGSRARIKILKFLFRNKSVDFTLRELAERTQESRSAVKREVDILREIGLLRKKR